MSNDCIVSDGGFGIICKALGKMVDTYCNVSKENKRRMFDTIGIDKRSFGLLRRGDLYVPLEMENKILELTGQKRWWTRY